MSPYVCEEKKMMMMMSVPEPTTGDTCAHVEFFLPIQLQKQSQLRSRELFYSKCFHLCIPKILMGCCSAHGRRWRNMAATCSHHERGLRFWKLKIQPGEDLFHVLEWVKTSPRWLSRLRKSSLSKSQWNSFSPDCLYLSLRLVNCSLQVSCSAPDKTKMPLSCSNLQLPHRV